MNRVMVQPNPIKEEAVQVSRKLVSLLLCEGFEVFALEEFYDVLAPGLTEEELAQLNFMKAPDIYPACVHTILRNGHSRFVGKELHSLHEVEVFHLLYE